ncbi:histidine-phosphotransfer domain, HPT domain-containing protein [Parathielavia appendiculata]|uniref:Histidine-phosphotransfer domain, HPT domain-containing protein n=1 Tax=Parathielavia appendiculata TaxID=2587402 RepID=A0AAN6TY49_9PEZI|nr:histidine-phosphotransfer domain, HPT domain-containing protein [Parathielavia appendiculata]
MRGIDDRSLRQDEQEIDDMPEFGDDVDNELFSQILEMDESEEDRDFSAPLVLNFFEQAEETFAKMQEALNAKNLESLSSLGHFLKGSSATLGFNKIRDGCQIIQQYGHQLNVDGTPETDPAVCLKRIAEALSTVQADTAKLEKVMKKFFSQTE